jgi:hypothetical protein
LTTDTREDRETAEERTAETLARYYSVPAVRSRIAQYCGGGVEGPRSFTALGMAGYGGRRRLRQPEGAPVPALFGSWTTLLDDGADVCRSLADSGGTLLQVDVDYNNPEEPAEPYRSPEDCFAALEPVHQVLSDALLEYGVRPLVVMTGRGYHFTTRVPLGSPLHAALLEIARPGPALAERHEKGTRRTALAGRAHEGAGRLLEHLAHQVIRRLRGRAMVPTLLADVPRPGGGPFICLDLTAYADPVARRYSRCAFSSNQKASLQDLAPERPFVICLPRGRASLSSLLEAREDPGRAARLASVEQAAIPDARGGVVWVEEYRRSGLAAFHREFDRGPQLEPGSWRWTYDALDLRLLPGCIALPLAFPNPALLRPSCLRTVALGLWGLGWHPRSIAGLVRSRYEQDHGWGTLWQRYAPAARAEYYVRLFCGAVADGVEDPRGLTCATQLQRGLCERDRCGRKWLALFDSLGERLSHKPGRAS